MLCRRDGALTERVGYNLPPGTAKLGLWRNQVGGEDRNRTYLDPLRIDNGFEDREGHQAPFTLREEEENAERPTPNAQRLRLQRCLLEFLDRADDLVEVRPVAGIEFGMEEFAIGADFEGAAARRNESERFDALAEFENFGRQTDGLRRVVSNDAVFDRYFGFHLELSFPQR